MDHLRSADPDLAAAIERRARAWLAEYGADFPGDRTLGTLGKSVRDQEKFQDFANHAPCPALDPATGRCDVYAWRPMTCRVFGPPVRATDPDSAEAGGNEGLGHCELCFVGATPEQVAACEMPVPHELEAELIDETCSENGTTAETIVPFALIASASPPRMPR
jgi:Fe-S-cluster containining protein